MLYDAKNPHGGDTYGGGIRVDLSANVNPLGTPPAVLEAAKASLSLADRYPDPFCRDLAAAISAHDGVPMEYVLCGNGAAELIYAWCAALRPETALETAPAFTEYSAALERTGCRVMRHPLRAEDGFLLDRGFCEAIRRQAPEAVFLTNPNNPTGRTVDPALLREILAVCGEAGSRLFLDECFLDLSDRRDTLADRLACAPHLTVLRAFTKAYGMAGLRLGYCLTSDAALLREMSRSVQPWNVSVPAQAAGIAALGESAFLEKARSQIRRERAFLSRSLSDLGLTVIPSEANFLLFSGPAGLDGKLRGRGIAVRNCENFPGLGPGWYRCAVRSRRESGAFLSALAEILEKE